MILVGPKKMAAPRADAAAVRRLQFEAHQWRRMAVNLAEEVKLCEAAGFLPPVALERLRPLLDIITSQPPSSPSETGTE